MSEDFQGFRRLRKSWEYQRVKQVGCRYSTPHFVLIVADNQLESSRLGVTVSRRVGNAVERNRIKRLSREFFRTNRVKFPHQKDFSVIARRGAARLSSCEVRSQLEIVFMKSTRHND